ncbi:MAG: anthranilate phosphoribosyltransferase [Magnetococcales bacterium]|nr:anthranilate phosphoribosyltransferase [Magnetococcales bacterium]
MNIQQSIAHLVDGLDLTQAEAHRIMDQIMSGEATDAQIGAYLTALRIKGETVEEIAGSALAMREKALQVKADGVVVDTCGTGGDGSGTFNISTTAAFVVAASGVNVAKHGNRSISSKSGSADVLKALGVNIEAGPEIVERCIAVANIGFIFAPKHHGAMRHVMGPRRELAMRTIFNLLGPLTNPANAPFQIIGVFDGALTEPMALVLGRMGSKRALVVHGSDGLDEITTTGPTRVAELDKNGRVSSYVIEPEQFGLPRAESKDLKGGEAGDNAKITLSVLGGEKGPQRDIVALNAGAGLCVAGMARDIGSGLEMACGLIDSGKAMEKLSLLVKTSNQPV